MMETQKENVDSIAGESRKRQKKAMRTITDKETGKERITVEEYRKFWTTTCMRNFSSPYYMLGMAEEAAEVLEEVMRKADRKIILKECGDVLWYMTGMILKSDIDLSSIYENWWNADRDPYTPQLTSMDATMKLLLAVGHLAGRIKKYERGDYGEDALKAFVKKHVADVCESLSLVCVSYGGVS